MRLHANELCPRDIVNIYDEETGKYIIARVASIDNGKVYFTDGFTLKVYDDRDTVEVVRLKLIMGNK